VEKRLVAVTKERACVQVACPAITVPSQEAETATFRYAEGADLIR